MTEDRRQPKPGATARRNASVAVVCATCVVLMVGAAYAAVPLYRLFCQVTGYGGTTRVAEGVSDRVLERKVTIRFDANVAGGLPWEFGAKQREITVNVGAASTMDYVAVNRAAHATLGTSTFNVTPFEAGAYFNKIDCFCFTEQQLAAGERLEMPVVFYVDPEFDADPHLKSVKTITLSYTFFPARQPEKPVAAAQERRTAKDEL